MLIFVVVMVGLLGTFLLTVGGVTWVFVTLMDRRLGTVRIPAGMVCGYIAGALLVWSLVPGAWPLPLGTTLAAAFDAEKYGHAVEHVAEAIVVWMLFAAVVGAFAGGLLAHKAAQAH